MPRSTSLFALALTLASVTTSSYFAQGASLYLKGTVAPTCSLVVTSDPTSVTLDLTSASAIKVGALNVVCNNANGFSIKATSAQNGNLRETGSRVAQVPYEIEIAGAGTAGYKQPSTTSIVVVTQGVIATPVNRTTDISFKVKANTNTLAGTFDDTVTLTLETL